MAVKQTAGRDALGEFALSDLGESMQPIIRSMQEWGCITRAKDGMNRLFKGNLFVGGVGLTVFARDALSHRPTPRADIESAPTAVGEHSICSPNVWRPRKGMRANSVRPYNLYTISKEPSMCVGWLFLICTVYSW